MWPFFNPSVTRAASHIPSSGVQEHAGYFRVSIIHRTQTRTTGSLMCVHSYACVYTRGVWGMHTDNESAQHFDSGEQLSQFFFIVLRTGFDRISGHGIHWISRPTLYPLSHHAPHTVKIHKHTSSKWVCACALSRSILAKVWTDFNWEGTKENMWRVSLA